MRRREFIALAAASILGGGTGIVPAALAQQPGERKQVGFLLLGGNPDGSVDALDRAYVEAVRAGLKEQGFIDGANVTLDVHLGLNDVGLTRAAAHDLAGGGYDVLVGGGTAITAALLAETWTIPIIAASVSDPIGSGFVQSFARPGGNVTGFTNVEASWGGKWLEMLHEVAPGVQRATLMSDPDAGVGSNFFLPSFQAAAGGLGIAPVVVDVRTLAEIDAAIAAMGKAPGTGLVLAPDTYTLNNRRTMIDAVARENVAAVYPHQEFVEDGGLIAYGSDLADVFRRAGGYVGLILKGARPSELPVQAPTKFVLSVNLKTAKAQGIAIPPVLVASADEVIQ